MAPQHDYLIDRLKKLPTEIRLLVEKRIELYVLEFGEKLSKNVAKILANLVSVLIVVLAVVFALIALSLFVGDVLQSSAAGFAVVAALLLVCALVVYLLSPDLLEQRFRNSIASAFLDSDEESSSQTGEATRNPIMGPDDTQEDSSSGHTIKHIQPN
jgi:uncharacterized membrane protein YqjE